MKQKLGYKVATVNSAIVGRYTVQMYVRYIQHIESLAHMSVIYLRKFYCKVILMPVIIKEPAFKFSEI